MRNHFTGEVVISQPHTIRVLIADDHTIVRRGIKAFLAEADDVQVVGEADSGLEAVRLSKQLDPDIILMDLLMPKMDGIEAIRQVMAGQPHMRILVMTSFVHEDKIFPAIKAGALGYFLKESEPSELIRSIYQVYRGDPSLHSGIARKILQEINQMPVINPTPDPLTAREMDVLQLLAKGLSNEEIAAQLAVSGITIQSHISHLLAKLHMADRVQATLYALHEEISYLREELESNISIQHHTTNRRHKVCW